MLNILVYPIDIQQIKIGEHIITNELDFKNDAPKIKEHTDKSLENFSAVTTASVLSILIW